MRSVTESGRWIVLRWNDQFVKQRDILRLDDHCPGVAALGLDAEAEDPDSLLIEGIPDPGDLVLYRGGVHVRVVAEDDRDSGLMSCDGAAARVGSVLGNILSHRFRLGVPVALAHDSLPLTRLRR